jgi:hypothetical protein
MVESHISQVSITRGVCNLVSTITYSDGWIRSIR